MKRYVNKHILYSIALLTPMCFYACTNTPSDAQIVPSKADHQLQAYWFDGKAEINTYALDQVRYGELHKGTAVAIFVTEDFSKSKQVKTDQTGSSNQINVLKFNLSKEFNTGIYPYRLFLSCYTENGPNSNPKPLKISSVVHEWCGVAYSQFNQIDNNYQVQNNSYFEIDESGNFKIPLHYPEDGLFNLIRLNPELLPIGEHFIIPSAFFFRLKHKPIKSTKTLCSSIHLNDDLVQYQMEMKEHNRVVNIIYKKAAPHEIESWTETYPEENTLMTTSARLIKRSKLAYWELHEKKDSIYRSEIGL